MVGILSIEVREPAPQTAASDGVPVEVSQMIEEFAPPSVAQHAADYARRCVSELNLDLQLPSGERKYVNAYPPKRYGSKRASAFDLKSGRVEIYCRPQNADGRELAEAVTNDNEPFATKVYLHSASAVDVAIELTRIGLEERER
ncbi:MAG: hypothetical protein WD830_07785 [Chloroflexota bacterium]